MPAPQQSHAGRGQAVTVQRNPRLLPTGTVVPAHTMPMLEGTCRTFAPALLLCEPLSQRTSVEPMQQAPSPGGLRRSASKLKRAVSQIARAEPSSDCARPLAQDARLFKGAIVLDARRQVSRLRSIGQKALAIAMPGSYSPSSVLIGRAAGATGPSFPGRCFRHRGHVCHRPAA